MRDIPDKEGPRLGPYRSKKGPTQPQQGGPKEKTASGRKDNETMQEVRPRSQWGRRKKEAMSDFV